MATNGPSAEFIARVGSVFSGVRELASSLDDIAVHVTVQVRVEGLLHAADACTMPTFGETQRRALQWQVIHPQR
ncbi:hypothetical protein GCM10009085_21000 [Pseudomonas avellanae]|nr:hypothetical protein GCM10009085_21000 [Pseudomonas avellanae]